MRIIGLNNYAPFSLIYWRVRMCSMKSCNVKVLYRFYNKWLQFCNFQKLQHLQLFWKMHDFKTKTNNYPTFVSMEIKKRKWENGEISYSLFFFFFFFFTNHVKWIFFLFWNLGFMSFFWPLQIHCCFNNIFQTNQFHYHVPHTFLRDKNCQNRNLSLRVLCHHTNT